MKKYSLISASDASLKLRPTPFALTAQTTAESLLSNPLKQEEIEKLIAFIEWMSGYSVRPAA